MLRSGYSVPAVERELGTRRIIDNALSAEAERALLLAGASPEFLGRIKAGAYAIPEEEIAKAKQEVALQAQRKAAQEEESRRLNTLYQFQQAQLRPKATTAPGSSGAPSQNIFALLKGSLVTSRNGTLSTFNDAPFEKKKLIALYFSARWCGPCRKFTPQLVDYYNRVTAAHPEFEIVFVSRDRSAPAMEAYMRDMQMPWPAVQFEKVEENARLLAYAGDGIPCLVLVDADGRVVSHSYDGKTYLGPDKVLADLDRIFAGAPTQVAATR